MASESQAHLSQSEDVYRIVVMKSEAASASCFIGLVLMNIHMHPVCQGGSNDEQSPI